MSNPVPGYRLRRLAVGLALLAGLPAAWATICRWLGPSIRHPAGGSTGAAWLQMALSLGLASCILGAGRAWARLLARVAAASVLGTGLACAVAWASGWPLAICSPLTALCQASSALALGWLSFGGGRQAASLLALVSLGAGTLLLLSFGAGAPLMTSDSALVMSFPSALSALLMGTALLLANGTRTWPLSLFRVHHGEPGEPAHPRGPLLIFTLVVALLVIGGGFYLRGQLGQARRNAEAELRAIADLKATEVGEWYRIRISVADQALRSPLIRPLLERGLAHPDDPVARQLLGAWMESQRRIHGFQGIALLDGRERLLLSVAQDDGFGLPPWSRFQAALARPDVTVMDLHRDPGGRDVHLGLTVPLRGGALYFHLSADHYLFPLVQSWPVPSRTAETELMRLEGTDLVLLNDLRHQPSAALEMRMPAGADGRTVGSLAVSGRTGLLEGPDYRGVRVIAAARRVEGTPWFIVAKVDESEVYGPVRRQVWLTGTLLLGLVLAAGFGLGMMLRERDAEVLRTRLEMERDKSRWSARYQHLMHQAHDAILLLDPAGRILEVNDRAEAQYGCERMALCARSIQDLCAAETCRDLESRWTEMRREGGIRFESLHRRKDGTRFPVEVSAGWVELEGEGLIQCVVRDITERKAQEAQLARMNRLYAALSQVNQSIVWARDEVDLLTRIPQVLLEHAGFALAWIGRSDPETHRVAVVSRAGDRTGMLDRVEVRDDDSPEGRGAVGRVLRTGESCLYNDFLALAASSPWKEELERAGLASLAVLPLRRGDRVWGALAVYAAEPGFFGPPEMELLSEAAVDVSFALDHLDAQAEHRRMEARLNEVEKLESVGSLAAGVAHDMNNVLTAILTLSSLHRDDPSLDPSLVRALDTMSRACLRGRDLVAGLLGFARRDLEQEGPVHLRSLVEEAVQLLSRTTLQRIRFETVLEPAQPPIRGDAGALHRTLMNLCVNAVDAMPKGGTVTLVARGLPGGGQELRVQDTGEGMSEEVARRALEPFFSTKPRGKGTGLGLSMAYGTLKAHGGDLEIRSRPGQGTEIILRFPPGRVVSAGGEVEEAPAAAGVASGRRSRILLIDDDDLVLESLVPMLQALGHAVETASGGLEALRRIESGLAVDLVILDMNMPGMTGAEVLPRLRALRPDLPVLLASGHQDERLLELAAGDPRVASLPKPFTLGEIRLKVQALLDA